MWEQPLSEAPTTTGVQVSLHTIAEVLRDRRPLTHEIRTVLAELVDELGRILATAAVPPAEAADLAESIAQLARRASPRSAGSAGRGARSHRSRHFRCGIESWPRRALASKPPSS